MFRHYDNIFSMLADFVIYYTIICIVNATCFFIISLTYNHDYNKREKDLKLTFPASIIMMTSQCRTVLRRWAIVRTVQSAKLSLIVCWILASVAVSMDAVASSSTRICMLQDVVYTSYLYKIQIQMFKFYVLLTWLTLFLRKIALAKHINCLSPTEKFSPFSSIM